MAAEKGNKYAVGNDGGRPPIHTDPNEVQRLIDEYFEYIEGESQEVIKDVFDETTGDMKPKTVTEWIRKPEPPTVTGLSLHLGFCDKSSLYDYAKKDMFSHSIKRGIARIEKFHEIKAAYGDKCVGNIFVLKNFGWKDRVEQDVNQNMSITWNEQKTYE